MNSNIVQKFREFPCRSAIVWMCKAGYQLINQGISGEYFTWECLSVNLPSLRVCAYVCVSVGVSGRSLLLWLGHKLRHLAPPEHQGCVRYLFWVFSTWIVWVGRSAAMYSQTNHSTRRSAGTSWYCPAECVWWCQSAASGLWIILGF